MTTSARYSPSLSFRATNGSREIRSHQGGYVAVTKENGTMCLNRPLQGSYGVGGRQVAAPTGRNMGYRRDDVVIVPYI